MTNDEKFLSKAHSIKSSCVTLKYLFQRPPLNSIVFKFLDFKPEAKGEVKCVTITMITNSLILLLVEKQKNETIHDHQKTIINKQEPSSLLMP